MLLALRDIDKAFGGRSILKRISLELSPGSVTLLVGPNGAGKSTLLRIMAGLIRPDAGTVEQGCANIGYLGHATFLYPGLSALDNLAFWQQADGRDAAKATLRRALERVELDRFATEKAGAFSRGMAQRLNLARVLLAEPELLLLDEPGTGLDTRSRAMLRRETSDARARGAGVIWVSHDPADLDAADRILALSRKRLDFDGSAEEYARRPVPEAAC